jgi:hypothetical protein
MWGSPIPRLCVSPRQGGGWCGGRLGVRILRYAPRAMRHALSAMPDSPYTAIPYTPPWSSILRFKSSKLSGLVR